MRAESAGAKTWLLGAAALWAVCVWVLALFGLAGHVVRLPDDPSMAGRLPSPPARTAERLGPLQQYSGIGDRPLFSEDRRPAPFLIDPEGEQQPGTVAFNYILTSVLLTPNFRMAILQPPEGSGESIRVKEGAAPDAAPGWTLTSLEPRSAVFNGPEGERKLDLRVFDGNGGQPPTAITTPPVQGVAQPPQPTPIPPPPVPAQQQPPGNNAVPVPPPSVPATDAADSAQQAQAQQAQIEAIRQRIEERRKQLREQSQLPAVPGKNP